MDRQTNNKLMQLITIGRRGLPLKEKIFIINTLYGERSLLEYSEYTLEFDKFFLHQFQHDKRIKRFKWHYARRSSIKQIPQIVKLNVLEVLIEWVLTIPTIK